MTAWHDSVWQLDADECDGLECWERMTDEPDLRGVGATRGRSVLWPWSVGVAVMESIRRDPLESELRKAIFDALTAVAGVTEVINDDRETWRVAGSPHGDELVRAAATVVDAFAARAKAHLAALD